MVTLGTDDTDTMQHVNLSLCLFAGVNKLLAVFYKDIME